MPKAVRFDRYGGVDVLQVRDVDRPTTSPGRVLLRVKAAGTGSPWWTVLHGPGQRLHGQQTRPSSSISPASLSARGKVHRTCTFRIEHGAESARKRRSSAEAPAVPCGLAIALYLPMPTQILAIATTESRQNRPLAAGPRLVDLRSQTAIVRTLADQVERLTRAADLEGLGPQMVEEMARLGCRLLDAAAALAD